MKIFSWDLHINNDICSVSAIAETRKEAITTILDRVQVYWEASNQTCENNTYVSPQNRINQKQYPTLFKTGPFVEPLWRLIEIKQPDWSGITDGMDITKFLLETSPQILELDNLVIFTSALSG